MALDSFTKYLLRKFPLTRPSEVEIINTIENKKNGSSSKMVETETTHKYSSLVDEISMTMKSIKTTNIIENTRNLDTIKLYEKTWREIAFKLKSLLKSDWSREEYIEWRDNWKSSYIELSFQIFALKKYISSTATSRPVGYIEANYQSLKDRLANVAIIMMATKEASKVKSEESYQFHHKVDETV